MRLRFLLVVVAMVCLSGTSWAQDAAPVDFFAGYFSLLNFDEDDGERNTVHGWQTNIAAYFNDNIGFVGDIGGHYEEGYNAHEFLGGIRYREPLGGATPFAHFLLGGTRVKDGSFQDWNFTMGVGGGFDLPVTDSISIRALQADWLPVNGIDTNEGFKSLRVAFGFVFGFGE